MTSLDPQVLWRQRWRNVAQAVLLLGAIVALLGVTAWLLLGPAGLVWIAVLSAIALAMQPRSTGRLMLRSLGAVPLPVHAAPELHAYLRELAGRAGLPRVPALYYVPTSVLTALSVGRRDDAAVAVTDGLLRSLSAREVIGVLAHEVSHIRANDLWIMALSDVVSRGVELLAWVGLVLLFVSLPLLGDTLLPLAIAVMLSALPTVVTLLQLALSRAREYDADLTAATLTGDPHGLASALTKLARAEGRGWERMMAPRGRVPDLALLRTHPPTEERVRRLRELAPRRTPPLGEDVPVRVVPLQGPVRTHLHRHRWW